jgi:hypothetical protein
VIDRPQRVLGVVRCPCHHDRAEGRGREGRTDRIQIQDINAAIFNISVHPLSPDISPASFELYISAISLPMLMFMPMLMHMLMYCGSATVEI